MKTIIDIGNRNPDSLIGSAFTAAEPGDKNHAYVGKTIKGWSRTDMTPAGQRYVGFEIYHTDICLKFEGGGGVYVTVSSKGNF